MNRNFKIKQILIPERDEKNELTGINLTLDVVSMEKLKAIVNTPDGGTLTTEGLFFVCFENMPNKPKRLYVLSAESEGEIQILKYENYGRKSTKSWGRHRSDSIPN